MECSFKNGDNQEKLPENHAIARLKETSRKLLSRTPALQQSWAFSHQSKNMPNRFLSFSQCITSLRTKKCFLTHNIILHYCKFDYCLIVNRKKNTVDHYPIKRFWFVCLFFILKALLCSLTNHIYLSLSLEVRESELLHSLSMSPLFSKERTEAGHIFQQHWEQPNY